jgi:hypothetical protein
MRGLLVFFVFAALMTLTVWAPHVAVMQVDITGEGLEKKEVIPEKRYQMGAAGPEGKNVKTWEQVEPGRVIIHPAKGERVVASLGRHGIGEKLRPVISGEIRPVVARVDWDQLFLEYALILGGAAFALALAGSGARPDRVYIKVPSPSQERPHAEKETGNSESAGSTMG